MKILVIDDNPSALEEISIAIRSSKSLNGRPYDITKVLNYEEALKRIDEKYFDIVIVDMKLGPKGNEGMDILKYLAGKSSVAIVITGFDPTIPKCVEAMRAGAWDYIEKQPADGSDPYERLLDSIRRAYEHFQKHPERGVPNPDIEWIHKHFDELVKEYAGKLVAVLYEKVVDSDKSFGTLSNRIESKFPLAKPTIVSIPDLSKEGI